ncbi:hypothetical protein [Caballeronia sp. BCC1704]|uniref:hypothetical protein n=1 Tax=Caballeronia sp. BCC1704 TaxID=2676300 RepID=UPI00158CC5D1|nr:hypothetical protein [Caballeronia sp. BCC1704]
MSQGEDTLAIKSDFVQAIKLERSSTIRLLKLLEHAERSISDFREWPGLVAAVSSQAALAGFKDESLGIFPCSLNTLKKRANSEIGMQWATLDAIRAKLVLEFSKERTPARTSRPGRGSKADLELKLKNLRADYHQLQSDNWQLVKGIRALLSTLDSIVQQYSDEGVEKQVKTERAEIMAMFSLLNQPVVRRNEEAEGE